MEFIKKALTTAKWLIIADIVVGIIVSVIMAITMLGCGDDSGIPGPILIDGSIVGEDGGNNDGNIDDDGFVPYIDEFGYVVLGEGISYKAFNDGDDGPYNWYSDRIVWLNSVCGDHEMGDTARYWFLLNNISATEIRVKLFTRNPNQHPDSAASTEIVLTLDPSSITPNKATYVVEDLLTPAPMFMMHTTQYAYLDGHWDGDLVNFKISLWYNHPATLVDFEGYWTLRNEQVIERLGVTLPCLFHSDFVESWM